MDKNIIDAAHRHFQKTDRVMAKIIKQCGAITINKSKPPHYHALVSAIINQQLSVKAGRTIEKRLLDKNGGRFFKAENILKLETTVIRGCGLSNNKVSYIRTLAEAIQDGELNFRKLSRSVDMFLMFSLQRLDVFPIGDLAIRRSMQQHYQLPGDAKHEKYISIAEGWRPYRSIASFYLWKMSDQN
jgi:DNA-3-methyladenine glycosylase II